MRSLLALALAAAIAGCSPSATPSTPPASNVPCGPSEVLIHHEHAHLTIVIRGQLRTVPANIGITATQFCWLHTHDTSGIIHVEAADDRTFTLADFFGVWRQPLSATVLAGESVGSGEAIRVTVNQQPYTGAPETIVLRNKQEIVLQLGPPNLEIPPFVWPPRY